MTIGSNDDRQSKALSAELITDPVELAEREARNGLLQFDLVDELIEAHSQADRPFRLRPSLLLSLHRVALDGISSYAGNFRPAGVDIGGSRPEPPGAHLVPELVEDMCDYVNANPDKPAIHLSAFTLWRLNWIHPFVDGNGRTARALSYFILCARLGYRLPGVKTIPELIAAHKKPYYAALEAADEAARDGKIDVSEMERLTASHLATRLYGVHQQATGGGDPPSGAPNR
jgi:Fic family protein